MDSVDDPTRTAAPRHKYKPDDPIIGRRRTIATELHELGLVSAAAVEAAMAFVRRDLGDDDDQWAEFVLETEDTIRRTMTRVTAARKAGLS